MKVKIESVPPTPLDWFCEAHQLTVEVRHHVYGIGGMYAKLAHDGCSHEVMEPGVLIGLCGRGKTPLEAVQDLCAQLSRKRIAFHAGTEKRVEIDVPRLIAPDSIENDGEPAA